MKIIHGKGLRIKNVHPSDGGVYVCEASNLMGKIATSAQLRVSERPVITVRPKAHLQQPIGKAINLECMVTGTPKPVVYWAREGDDAAEFVMPGMRRNNMYVTSDGALKIETPSVENSGHYACAAVNEVGSAMARSHLVVFDPADFEKENSSPIENHVKTYEKESDTFERDEARLALLERTIADVDVVPLGTSSVRVTWRLLGADFDHDDDESSSSLTIPAAVRYIDGYRVHYRRRSTDTYEDFEVVTVPRERGNEFKVMGLETYVEYEVFVQPFSKEVILGQPSPIRVVRTHPDLPSTAPEILTAEMLNSSAAFVAWNKLDVDEHNGDLLGYQVSRTSGSIKYETPSKSDRLHSFMALLFVRT